MGPLLFLFPDEDDGGGLLEAAEDGRELFFVEERSFIDFIVVNSQMSLFLALSRRFLPFTDRAVKP